MIMNSVFVIVVLRGKFVKGYGILLILGLLLLVG